MTAPKPRCEDCKEILFRAQQRNPDGTTRLIWRCPRCGKIRPVKPKAPLEFKAFRGGGSVDSLPRDQAAEEFRKRRIFLGWSQKEFAEYLGLNPGVVNRWERRVHPVPSYAFRVLELLEQLGGVVSPQGTGE